MNQFNNDTDFNFNDNVCLEEFHSYIKAIYLISLRYFALLLKAFMIIYFYILT